MDPALALITDTVTSNLVHSLTYARAVFGPIGDLYVAYNYRIGAAELEAFEALRRTVVDVKDDIKFFKTMISALESTEDQLFLQRNDVKNAMERFHEKLSALTVLLSTGRDITPSDDNTPSDGNNSLRSTLMRVASAMQRTLVSDVNETRNKILNNQQNINRDFKLICIKSWTGALGAISWEFIGYPFGISRSCGSFSLSVLDRDHNAASRLEELARKLGRGWIDDLVNRHHVPVNQLIDVQITLYKLIWSGTVPQLKGNLTRTTNDPELREFEITLNQLYKSSQEVIARSKQPRFTTSFYGMAKAGKSLFLNSLIGNIVLPSNELPSTVWPCRLVHVKGMKQPKLCVKTEPFDNAIKCLRDKCYGAQMKQYRPPTTSVLSAMIGDGVDSEGETSPEANKLEKIYHEWKSLHIVTQDNLHTFEEPGFQLPHQVCGVEAVNDLLGKINDIVRLCKRFDVKFEGTEEDWPVLSVEFSSLKDRNVNEIYEFIDLPAIGEHFENSSWESLLQIAASQSNAIIPIVSFTELSRGDWRELPKLAGCGYNRKADLVVCTHLDRVSGENLQQQTWTVSKSFWPGTRDESDRVLKCSSLMGLSASQLLEQTKATKPPFKEVWDKTSIRYQCALKILGEGEPEFVYSQYDRGGWEEKVEEQLEYSGLPHVIHKLVDNARKTALTNETVEAIRLVRELRKKTERKLLEARRTEVEFEEAKNTYNETSQKLQAILDTWVLRGQEQIDKNRKQLQNACAKISRKADGFVQPALEKVLQLWGLVDRASDNESTISLPRTPPGAEFTNQVLKVTSVADANEFLRLSQGDLHIQLSTLKAEYLDSVRCLGQEAKSFRITTLRDILENATDIQAEIRDDVIAEIESRSSDIREFADQETKKVMKKSFTRYAAKTAFQTIETRISRKYDLDVDVVTKQYKDQIVQPWLESLNKEGERTLLGTIRLGFNAARDSLHSALEREKARYQRAVENMQQPLYEETVGHLIATYVNLLAAEEALQELNGRIDPQ